MLSISIAFSQPVDPDTAFHIDQNFHFKHYDDLVVLVEYVNRQGDTIIDTNYSCEYDDHGRTIKERYQRDYYTNQSSGVNLNYYDSLNRLVISTHYDEPPSNGEITDVSITEYSYTDFDSVSFTECYYWKRFNDPPIQTDSGFYISPGPLKNKGEWSYIGGYAYSYDSHKRKVVGRTVRPLGYNFDKIFVNLGERFDLYKYDKEGRLLFHQGHLFAINGSPHNQSFKYHYFYYPDSTIILNEDTSYYVINVKKFYNENGLLIKETESGMDHDGIFNTRIDFHYDQKGRIREKLLFREDHLRKYQYFYKE